VVAEAADQSEIAITLTSDEAVVLFEVLHRWEDNDYRDVEIADSSEQIALWNLSCLLERVLVEPFRSNYGDLLHAAQARLKREG
jgi:hypothetical protein